MDRDALRGVALEAGEILMKHFGRLDRFERKGARDLVTVADREAEEHVLERLRSLDPGVTIVAEESSTGDERPASAWIVDPLDGTTNFVHGIPHFAVSIAKIEDGVPVLACVHNPRLGETFSAARGEGAFLGDERLRVSEAQRLGDAVVATGFHYRRETNPDSNLEHFRDFALRVRGVRRLGSAACDLCYLAAGRYDGFWELELSPWDVAAGGLVAREAGALVSDFSGGDDWIYGKSILAAGPALHPLMKEVLDDANPEALPGPGYPG